MRIFSLVIEIEFGTEKREILVMYKLKIDKTEWVELPNQEAIVKVKEKEIYKYQLNLELDAIK